MYVHLGSVLMEVERVGAFFFWHVFLLLVWRVLVVPVWIYAEMLILNRCTVDICYLFIWVRFSHSNNNITRISSNNLKANLLICALYLILNISEPILINSLCSIQLLLIIRNFQFLMFGINIKHISFTFLSTFGSLITKQIFKPTLYLLCLIFQNRLYLFGGFRIILYYFLSFITYLYCWFIIFNQLWVSLEFFL